MSDINETQQPENKNPNNSRTIILVILILLLVGVNIYLYIRLNSKTQIVTTQTTELQTDSVNYTVLDGKYSSALKDIESLKGQNTSLDSLVNAKTNEIKNMKAALDNSRRSNKISKAEYDKKMADLEGLVNDLKNQITQLENEKKILVTQKDSLGKNLDKQVETNTQLTTTNKDLSKKVQIGSLLKAQNIVVTGVRTKGKGKEVTTNNAKKAEKIKVSFDIDENKVADAGKKTFQLRIIGPGGSTLNVQSSGGGVFNLADGGQIEYSTSKDIDYKQDKEKVDIYYGSGTAQQFGKGKYTIELYQDGYKTGTKDYNLK